MNTTTPAKSFVEKYRSLPEARYTAPEWVQEAAKQERYVEEMEAQVQQARTELEEIKARAIETLQLDWSDEELKEAGLI